jgi:ABC-type nitrate/sulfonate/bicarbonate transport system substrate-binding protein
VDGSATFACVPSESVISYHTWPNGEKPKIVAVAALLQSNQSAIVTLKSSGIDRPAQLDGKKYASYAARCACCRLCSSGYLSRWPRIKQH